LQHFSDCFGVDEDLELAKELKSVSLSGTSSGQNAVDLSQPVHLPLQCTNLLRVWNRPRYPSNARTLSARAGKISRRQLGELTGSERQMYRHRLCAAWPSPLCARVAAGLPRPAVSRMSVRFQAVANLGADPAGRPLCLATWPG